jgi:hypothetical protein
MKHKGKRIKENCNEIFFNIEKINSERAEPSITEMLSEDYSDQNLLTKQWNSSKDQIWDNIDDYDEV